MVMTLVKKSPISISRCRGNFDAFMAMHLEITPSLGTGRIETCERF